ncbi:MAG: carbohydrate binding domain-containing protein [Planctomycetota bacterium]
MSSTNFLKSALAALVVALAPGSWPLRAAAGEPPNLVANGDFSQVTDGKPDTWAASGNPRDVTQTLEVVKDADGKPCAKISCTRFEKRGSDSHAMLAQVGAVNLVKGRTYAFSCRARAENLKSRTVRVALSETKSWSPTGLFEELPVGGAWRSYHRVFTATQDVGPTGRLQIWFTETGTFFTTDIRIVEYPAQDVAFTDLVPPAGGKNLAPNGSFEVGAAGWDSIGAGAGWGNLSRLHGNVETAGGAHGRSFLRIPLGGDDTPVLGFDYFEPVVRRELRPLAASRGWIRLEKGQPHTLSCQMRASEDGVPAVLGIQGQEPAGGARQYRQAIKLTKAWKLYSVTFRPEQRFGYVFAGPDLTEERSVSVDVDAVQLEKGDTATGFEPRTPVEFAIEPSQPAGIFVEGPPAALRLVAANHGVGAAPLKVGFTVTDYADTPAPLPEQALAVPAGAIARGEIVLPADWRGYYRIRATAGNAGAGESADLRIAIVPARTANDSVLGINHAFTTPHLIDLAAKAGVTWYRDWSLKWQHIEPEKGRFRWEVGDRQIARVLKQGARVLPLLPPFPSADWSSEAPASLHVTTEYPGNRMKQAFAPRDSRELAGFVEAAVGRYKDRVHVWEFLNEPVYTTYALPAREVAPGGRRYEAADYAALLAVAATAMKKADPDCTVIGGIGGGPDDLTREVIAAGALKNLDIFNLHIYPGARAPESFAGETDQLLARMDAAGGRRPIWITEFSYYGTDDLPRKPFVPRPNNWAEQRLLDGERQCADYTVRFFAVMLARGAGKIFLHSGASGRVNEPNLECALFGGGGAPRKLFPALAVMTGLLGPAPRPAGETTFGESGRGVAFETGSRSVLMLWKEDEEAAGGNVNAPAQPGITWLDLMERPLAAPVSLSSSPVYLVAPPGKAREMLDALQRGGKAK